MAKEDKKLGIVGLTAIVFGSMIGSGIFNIVQNMSDGASPGAVILSWIITGVGMLFLVFTFKALADRRPDLDAGIYQYAQETMGRYVGFNVAWGYWLCTSFANVAYGVMLNDAIGVFFPELLRHGWESVILGSLLIWSMYFLVIRGINKAALLNTIITASKIAALFLMVTIIIIYFKVDTFTSDFWGQIGDLGGVTSQVRRTMLVTLWCFIGIEGAVVMSARAKRSSDVGKAGVMGFFLAWILYAAVSVMAFGVLPQAQLEQLGNPSVAYLLRDICGEWAYYFVIISVICSLLGGWLAWTLICAQVPYEAAEHHVMPKQFMFLNRHNVPTHGLLVATIIMQIFYLLVIMAENVYLTAIEVSGMMILPAYLSCGIFLWVASYRKERFLHLAPQQSAARYRIVGVVCTLYCLWLMYSGGLGLLMATSIFYLPGVYFYIVSRKQWSEQHHKYAFLYFTRKERWVFALMFVCAIASIPLIIG